MNRLIAIVGPTAVGKSQLALSLAQHFDGEIVNADSRQVYRYMDIGTSKPTQQEQEQIPHHLVDVVDPDGDFSLSLYSRMASEAIKAVHQRNRLPLLVGGSGLYIWSLVEGWAVPPVPPNGELRRALELRAQRESSGVLHRELEAIDPLAASKIHPNNARRVIRALEVYQATGQVPSKLWRKIAPEFPVLVIGLTMERSELYGKIDHRIDKMIQRGLIEEVKGLLERGYSISLPSMSGIGYKQMGQFCQGEITLSAAREKMSFETHRLVRHQNAWFRPGDWRIHWMGEAGREMEARRLIEDFLT